jgi:hypothetical protein
MTLESELRNLDNHVRRSLDVAKTNDQLKRYAASLLAHIDMQNVVIAELVVRCGGSVDIPDIVFEENYERKLDVAQLPGALLLRVENAPKPEETHEETEN